MSIGVGAAITGRKRARQDDHDGALVAARGRWLYGIEQRRVSPHFTARRRLLGFVDVGRTNMGLCFLSNDAHWSDPMVECVARRDIALGAARPPAKRVRLDLAVSREEDGGGGRETADLVASFVASWLRAFDACDRVFIERQPPGGMRDVEQLLYAALGGSARVSFLAPNTMHAYFRMGAKHGWGRYGDRKTRSETIAARFIAASGTSDAQRQWASMGERRHDAADATLMAIFVNEQKRREWVDACADRR